MREYVGMAEDIYEPIVPNLQGRTVHQKVLFVEHIIVRNSLKEILDR